MTTGKLIRGPWGRPCPPPPDPDPAWWAEWRRVYDELSAACGAPWLEY